MYKNLPKNLFQRTLHSNKKFLPKFIRSYADEATLNASDFKLHKLTEGPSTNVSLTKEDALKLIGDMFTLRAVGFGADTLYREKFIRGFCTIYNGQEACAVGIKSVLRPEDNVVNGYRTHGWAYLMGVPLFGVFAELTGRQGGCCRGKGGSAHMFAKKMYGGYAIIGAHVPLGVGVAFAGKYRNQKAVCITVYGDGAANQGQVFEVFNMAKLLNIPCIFVCENNNYAFFTSTKRAAANNEYYTRGDYVPGIWVNGMDVLAVRSATKYAIDHCDSGNGPIILEMATYRYFGHSMGDPGTGYRTQEEIEEVREKRDPITMFREKIISSELVTAEEIKNIEAERNKHVNDAMDKAKTDKEIPLEEIAADIYVKPISLDIRNLWPNKSYKHMRVGKTMHPTE